MAWFDKIDSMTADELKPYGITFKMGAYLNEQGFRGAPTRIYSINGQGVSRADAAAQILCTKANHANAARVASLRVRSLQYEQEVGPDHDAGEIGSWK